MRRIFSSPRSENCEQVAQLLSDAGIDIKLTQQQAEWKKATKRDFRYTDKNAVWPAVWVKRAEDYTAARQILKNAGLLLDTQSKGDYIPPHNNTVMPVRKTSNTTAVAFKVRIALVVVALLIAVWTIFFR